MNRVTTMIANIERTMKERIEAGFITAEKIEEHRKTLDLELSEYVRFQEMKSIASTDGTLTLDEAQTVYRYLGETPDTFAEQSFAVKYVLTKLFQELLAKRIGTASLQRKL